MVSGSIISRSSIVLILDRMDGLAITEIFKELFGNCSPSDGRALFYDILFYFLH